MPKTRKSHPPSLKAKVAVEAIKAHKTAAQIAQMFGVHPTQVGGWKKQALAGLPEIAVLDPSTPSAAFMMPEFAKQTIRPQLPGLARDWSRRRLILVSPATSPIYLQNYPRA